MFKRKRLKTGLCGFRKHMSILRIAFKVCRKCGEDDETAFHVIFN
jgi:hypothetical protein